MRDIDIRRVLLSKVKQEHSHEPGTRIVEELGLRQGASRVDIAVVNGNLHGFEIKSERDTLARLPAQRESYNQTFDYVTIVCSSKHLRKIEELVPDWWEIRTVDLVRSKPAITVQRPRQKNTEVSPLAVAQLLWRDEALDILRQHDLGQGCAAKTRNQLWQRLVEVLETDELCQAVRTRLKVRQLWRADPLQASCDGLPQLFAK